MFFIGSNDIEVVSYLTQCGASSSADPDMPAHILARQKGQGRIKWRNTAPYHGADSESTHEEYLGKTKSSIRTDIVAQVLCT